MRPILQPRALLLTYGVYSDLIESNTRREQSGSMPWLRNQNRSLDRFDLLALGTKRRIPDILGKGFEVAILILSSLASRMEMTRAKQACTNNVNSVSRDGGYSTCRGRVPPMILRCPSPPLFGTRVTDYGCHIYATSCSLKLQQW